MSIAIDVSCFTTEIIFSSYWMKLREFVPQTFSSYPSTDWRLICWSGPLLIIIAFFFSIELPIFKHRSLKNQSQFLRHHKLALSLEKLPVFNSTLEDNWLWSMVLRSYFQYWISQVEFECIIEKPLLLNSGSWSQHSKIELFPTC